MKEIDKEFVHILHRSIQALLWLSDDLFDYRTYASAVNSDGENEICEVCALGAYVISIMEYPITAEEVNRAASFLYKSIRMGASHWASEAMFTLTCRLSIFTEQSVGDLSRGEAIAALIALADYLDTGLDLVALDYSIPPENIWAYDTAMKYLKRAPELDGAARQ